MYPSFCEYKNAQAPSLFSNVSNEQEGGSLCIACTCKNSDMFTNLPSAKKTLL